MVGRERERALLADAWRRSRSERACALFTVLGAAGVGKSRLAAEFLDGLDARGRRAAAASPTARASPTGRSIEVGEAAARRRLEPLRTPRDRRARSARPSAALADEIALGGAQAARGGRRGAAARRRLRRHPLGRADVPRPGRARRRLVARRADPAPLHGPARAARAAAGLGRRQAERDDGAARAARRPTRRTS